MSRELHHFLLLTREEQHAAIRRLASAGMNEYSIAAATRLSVEMIRRILGERDSDIISDTEILSVGPRA